MLPLFLRSRSLQQAYPPNGGGATGDVLRDPRAWLAHPRLGQVLALAAAGELLADKTPLVPARTRAMPLLGRALCGAIAGGSAAAVQPGEPARAPAPDVLLAGALGAVAGTLAGYHLRRLATRRLGLPDLAVALLEDLVCWRWARSSIRGRRG